MRSSAKRLGPTARFLKRVPGRNLFFRFELDNGHIAIETQHGKQVGTVWWRPTGEYIVEIEHLEINPAYQNAGLGTALLREFAAVLPRLHPQTRFVTGNATSQGIVRLLRKVFGPERDRANVLELPRRSPRDWYKTDNRVHVRFRALPQESVTARRVVDMLLEQD